MTKADICTDDDQNDRFWEEWAKNELHFTDVLIDVIWARQAWIKSVVKEVKTRAITTIEGMPFRPYLVLGLLENSQVLYDRGGEIEDLKNSLYPYPPALKEKLVNQSLMACKEALVNLRDYVEREIGNTAFHFHLQEYLDSFYTLLFAVNEKYDPATKRFERYFGHFKICPERFRERFESALAGPFRGSNRSSVVNELEAFLTEIEEHL